MAGPPERFGHVDNNTDVKILRSGRTDSSSPSRRASERSNAKSEFDNKSKQVLSTFDEVDKFMGNNGENLERYGFQKDFHQKLITRYVNKSKERIQAIQGEIQDAEVTVGGLTINRLKERISEIEALGESWETRLKLLKQLQEDQEPLATAKTYKEIHEEILTILAGKKPVRGFLSSLARAKAESRIAQLYLITDEGDPKILSGQAGKLEGSTTSLKDKYYEVQKYLEQPRVRLVAGAIIDIRQELKCAGDYYMLSWTYNLDERSLDHFQQMGEKVNGLIDKAQEYLQNPEEMTEALRMSKEALDACRKDSRDELDIYDRETLEKAISNMKKNVEKANEYQHLKFKEINRGGFKDLVTELEQCQKDIAGAEGYLEQREKTPERLSPWLRKLDDHKKIL